MTDRDVIWIGPADGGGGPDICCDGECLRGYEERWCRVAQPFIPLTRAQSLQITITAIAEGLEDYRDAKLSGDREAPDPMDVIRDTARSARRALDEFERTEK